jgi:hypothetical protein
MAQSSASFASASSSAASMCHQLVSLSEQTPLSFAAISSLLHRLLNAHVNLELLQETRVGLTLNQLRRKLPAREAELAKTIIKKWKESASKQVKENNKNTKNTTINSSTPTNSQAQSNGALAKSTEIKTSNDTQSLAQPSVTQKRSSPQSQPVATPDASKDNINLSTDAAINNNISAIAPMPLYRSAEFVAEIPKDDLPLQQNLINDEMKIDASKQMQSILGKRKQSFDDVQSERINAENSNLLQSNLMPNDAPTLGDNAQSTVRGLDESSDDDEQRQQQSQIGIDLPSNGITTSLPIPDQRQSQSQSINDDTAMQASSNTNVIQPAVSPTPHLAESITAIQWHWSNCTNIVVDCCIG